MTAHFSIKMENIFSSEKALNTFLTGRWKNEFSSDENNGFEICEIHEDGKYYIHGVHWFDIVDVKYNSETNKITFIKIAAKPGDAIKFYNELVIVNRNLIVGTYYLTGGIKSKSDERIIKNFSLKYKRLKIKN